MKQLSTTLLIACVMLSACGTEPVPFENPFPASSPPPKTEAPLATTPTEISDQHSRLDKVLADLGEIKNRFKQGGGLQAPAQSTQKTTTSKTKPSIGTPSNLGPGKKSPPAKKAKPKGLDAQSELTKVLGILSSAPFIDVTLEKVEKNVNTGKATSVTLKTVTKAPNLVTLEIIKSSINNGGTKATYTSGVGNKITVRPGGALGFIKTDFDKDNKLLVSENGFLLDEMDFFGVSKRLSNGYTAKLIGKSTLQGQSIHILKVVHNSGTNTLNPLIQYEHVGYDPKTHHIRLWEMYASESTPFFRLSISQISFPAQIADSKFKI